MGMPGTETSNIDERKGGVSMCSTRPTGPVWTKAPAMEGGRGGLTATASAVLRLHAWGADAGLETPHRRAVHQQ
eukprot:2041365-Amphidinium_carterae.2